MMTYTADRSVRGTTHRAWPFAVVSTPHAAVAAANAAAALESVDGSTS